jgi:hypothetical protein
MMKGTNIFPPKYFVGMLLMGLIFTGHFLSGRPAMIAFFTGGYLKENSFYHPMAYLRAL